MFNLVGLETLLQSLSLQPTHRWQIVCWDSPAQYVTVGHTASSEPSQWVSHLQCHRVKVHVRVNIWHRCYIYFPLRDLMKQVFCYAFTLETDSSAVESKVWKISNYSRTRTTLLSTPFHNMHTLLLWTTRAVDPNLWAGPPQEGPRWIRGVSRWLKDELDILGICLLVFLPSKIRR